MTPAGIVATPGEGILRLALEPTAAGSWDALLDGFDAELEAAELDARIRGVLLGIVGPDRGEVPAEGHLLSWVAELALRFERAAAVVRRCPKPVILALDRPLEGASLGLLALADLVVASPACVLRSGNLGAALPGLLPLLASAGMAARRAVMPLLTGRELDAMAARECGLLTDVVPAERMNLVVAALIQGILDAGPTAVALLKRAARGSPALG